jgi:hypothetical protein
MGIVRKPVRTVADPDHGTVDLEGNDYDVLSTDRVYVNPREGTIYDGRQGHRLKDLPQNVIEIPRTTWH